MEVPDILPWVKPNELLLTTAFALTRAAASQHTQLLLDLVTELDRRGLSAIGVKLGRYIDAIPAEVLALADALGFPVLQLPHAVAFDEVLAEVFTQLLDAQSRMLAQADAVHRAISTIVLAGGGLPQIAQEVSALLDCVVLITSPDGRVLADSGGDPDHATLREAELLDATGRVQLRRVQAYVQRGQQTNLAMTPIVAGGQDHGRVIAYRSGAPLPAGSVQALERAAIVAALSVTKELAVSAVEGKYRGDYLRDILIGLTPVDRNVVEHCRSLGWDISRPMVIVVAEPDSEEELRRSDNERLAATWQQVMRGRDVAAPVVGFSHEVVALLPVTGTDAHTMVSNVVAAVAAEKGGGRPFSVGVSRLIADPIAIAFAYAQARRAASVGRRTHGPGGVSHFDSLGVHRLLSLIADADELRSFANEVLGELAGDGSSAADLRATLQALLDTNLNVAETARLLHFHYNTLRYRIAKLERIIGPFTSDPHLRLDVALALKVVQMRGI
jgi:purine catabolism regulator